VVRDLRIASGDIREPGGQCKGDLRIQVIELHLHPPEPGDQRQQLSLAKIPAVRFSFGFYQALAPGRPVEQAFHLGRAQLRMAPKGDADRGRAGAAPRWPSDRVRTIKASVPMPL
jgi:hypothetical protein